MTTGKRRAVVAQAVRQAPVWPLLAHGLGARAQAEDMINTIWAGRMP
ncbi:hypothetical protein [Curvibacter sp. PAE-UM]|nr:hypothetical protein [Curvibacter sp. PAE-UM]